MTHTTGRTAASGFVWRGYKMSYIKLNGTEFDVNVAISEYKRKLNILHGENAGRVMSGKMILDPIGTYLGREITFFRRGDNYQGMDRLWDFLVAHSLDKEGVTLEAADGQSTISFRAYYGDTEQSIEKVKDGVNYWGEFSVSFIPIDPQVTP